MRFYYSNIDIITMIGVIIKYHYNSNDSNINIIN